jgi:hypothetical protein
MCNAIAAWFTIIKAGLGGVDERRGLYSPSSQGLESARVVGGSHSVSGSALSVIGDQGPAVQSRPDLVR